MSLAIASRPLTAPRPRLSPREPARADTAPPPAARRRGTLSPEEVRGAIDGQRAQLTGCFALRSMSFDRLGGQLQMSIRVDGSGQVLAAHPEGSTVGDRDVERCVRRVIRSVRFPETHGGGEALVHYAIRVQAPSYSQQTRTWSAARVAPVVRRLGTDALEQCHAQTQVQVTAYVSRGGRVINAGAASPEHHDDEVLDCVAQRVRAWRMPRSRHVSKVTFDIRS